MDRDESKEENMRKRVAAAEEEEEKGDIASSSHRLARPRITPHLSLQLGLLPSPPLFDLNSTPPPSPPSSPPPPPPPHVNQLLRAAVAPPPPPPRRARRVRRNQIQPPEEEHDENLPPPYPWATNRHAVVHSLSYLLGNQIHTISGDVQCKKCSHTFAVELDLKQKFIEVSSVIVENMDTMHDRAPEIWESPALPDCRNCGQENCAKPLTPHRNMRSINWLFLMLGQWLGLCSLEQLKYFCKHTRNHRTGAKDRLIYETYVELCKQLYPEGPFDYA